MTGEENKSVFAAKSGTRARLALVGLALLFSLPMISAWLLYAKPEWMALVWKPGETVNSGDLIVPARPLVDFSGVDQIGGAFTRDDLRGIWSMVVFVDTQCDQVCQQNLYNIRQVRLAQGRHLKRIQTIAVMRGDGKIPLRILADHPDLRLLKVESRFQNELFSQFDGEFGYSSSRNQRNQRIFIVDPLGNLMMSFDPALDPGRIKNDLKRLLKVSQVG